MSRKHWSNEHADSSQRFAWACHSAVVGFALFFASPESRAGEELPLDAQDVLVLRPGGKPLRFRLRLIVDGLPFRHVWRQFFEGLWKELDRNKDGDLDAVERLGLPWPAPPGPLSQEAYWKLCERQSPPLDVRASGFRSRSASGLFALLDHNRDGWLDEAELAAAPKLIGQRDFDDDGVLTVDELLPPFTPGEPRGAVVIAFRSDGTIPSETIALYKRLAEDLKAAAVQPVDAELWLSLGRSRLNAEPPRAAAGESGVDVRTTAAAIFVDAGDLKIDVRSSNGPMIRDAGFPSFRQLDVDQNDYLDSTELRSLLPADAFSLLDRDGDGKVSREEYRAFAVRRNRLLTATIVLHAADLGQELFDALDGDRDGRLTRLELQQAPKLLATLGRGEGRLGGKTFPRSLDWELTRGDTSSRQAGQAMRTRAAPAKKQLGPSPDWFRRMDLNADGVLERQEFLGKESDFDRLDANHDGLLTPAEAAAFPDARRAAIDLSRK